MHAQFLVARRVSQSCRTAVLYLRTFVKEDVAERARSVVTVATSIVISEPATKKNNVGESRCNHICKVETALLRNRIQMIGFARCRLDANAHHSWRLIETESVHLGTFCIGYAGSDVLACYELVDGTTRNRGI